MFKRIITIFVIFSFILSYYQPVFAQDFSINQLPVPGKMVDVSAPFAPLALKGLVVNLKNPLEFQFIVDTGRGPQDTPFIKEEARHLVKYFLAGLTIPEGELWVNLSPYEKNRMIPNVLGQTELGRDLLAQDYILKQLTASLIYPEKDLGKEFWNRVYKKAQEQFGTTNIPVNTFNKVWILPDQAQVFENGPAAYVTKSTLKVMLDEDYLAKQKHQQTQASNVSSQVVRAIIVPEIEKEVNTGKNFAPLRQIYQALILAKWYKETIQNSLLDAVYTNKRKVAGVNLHDPAVKEQIYNRYLQAYKKGVFNYIKEDPTPDGLNVPRKYFSGGLIWNMFLGHTENAAMIGQPDGRLLALKIYLKEPTSAAMNSPMVLPVNGASQIRTTGLEAAEAVRFAYRLVKLGRVEKQGDQFYWELRPDLIAGIEGDQGRIMRHIRSSLNMHPTNVSGRFLIGEQNQELEGMIKSYPEDKKAKAIYEYIRHDLFNELSAYDNQRTRFYNLTRGRNIGVLFDAKGDLEVVSGVLSSRDERQGRYIFNFQDKPNVVLAEDRVIGIYSDISVTLPRDSSNGIKPFSLAMTAEAIGKALVDSQELNTLMDIRRISLSPEQIFSIAEQKSKELDVLTEISDVMISYLSLLVKLNGVFDQEHYGQFTETPIFQKVQKEYFGMKKPLSAPDFQSLWQEAQEEVPLADIYTVKRWFPPYLVYPNQAEVLQNNLKTFLANFRMITMRRDRNTQELGQFPHLTAYDLRQSLIKTEMDLKNAGQRGLQGEAKTFALKQGELAELLEALKNYGIEGNENFLDHIMTIQEGQERQILSQEDIHQTIDYLVKLARQMTGNPNIGISDIVLSAMAKRAARNWLGFMHPEREFRDSTLERIFEIQIFFSGETSKAMTVKTEEELPPDLVTIRSQFSGTLALGTDYKGHYYIVATENGMPVPHFIISIETGSEFLAEYVFKTYTSSREVQQDIQSLDWESNIDINKQVGIVKAVAKLLDSDMSIFEGTGPQPKKVVSILNTYKEMYGIHNVGALIEKTADDLLHFHNLGEGNLYYVRMVLRRHGLYLRGEWPIIRGDVVNAGIMNLGLKSLLDRNALFGHHLDTIGQVADKTAEELSNLRVTLKGIRSIRDFLTKYRLQLKGDAAMSAKVGKVLKAIEAKEKGLQRTPLLEAIYDIAVNPRSPPPDFTLAELYEIPGIQSLMTLTKWQNQWVVGMPQENKDFVLAVVKGTVLERTVDLTLAKNIPKKPRVGKTASDELSPRGVRFMRAGLAFLGAGILGAFFYASGIFDAHRPGQAGPAAPGGLKRKEDQTTKKTFDILDNRYVMGIYSDKSGPYMASFQQKETNIMMADHLRVDYYGLKPDEDPTNREDFMGISSPIDLAKNVSLYWDYNEKDPLHKVHGRLDFNGANSNINYVLQGPAMFYLGGDIFLGDEHKAPPENILIKTADGEYSLVRPSLSENSLFSPVEPVARFTSITLPDGFKPVKEFPFGYFGDNTNHMFYPPTRILEDSTGSEILEVSSSNGSGQGMYLKLRSGSLYPLMDHPSGSVDEAKVKSNILELGHIIENMPNVEFPYGYIDPTAKFSHEDVKGIVQRLLGSGKIQGFYLLVADPKDNPPNAVGIYFWKKMSSQEFKANIKEAIQSLYPNEAMTTVEIRSTQISGNETSSQSKQLFTFPTILDAQATGSRNILASFYGGSIENKKILVRAKGDTVVLKYKVVKNNETLSDANDEVALTLVKNEFGQWESSDLNKQAILKYLRDKLGMNVTLAPNTEITANPVKLFHQRSLNDGDVVPIPFHRGMRRDFVLTLEGKQDIFFYIRQDQNGRYVLGADGYKEKILDQGVKLLAYKAVAKVQGDKFYFLCIGRSPGGYALEELGYPFSIDAKKVKVFNFKSDHRPEGATINVWKRASGRLSFFIENSDQRIYYDTASRTYNNSDLGLHFSFLQIKNGFQVINRSLSEDLVIEEQSLRNLSISQVNVLSFLTKKRDNKNKIAYEAYVRLLGTSLGRTDFLKKPKLEDEDIKWFGRHIIEIESLDLSSLRWDVFNAHVENKFLFFIQQLESAANAAMNTVASQHATVIRLLPGDGRDRLAKALNKHPKEVIKKVLEYLKKQSDDVLDIDVTLKSKKQPYKLLMNSPEGTDGLILFEIQSGVKINFRDGSWVHVALNKLDLILNDSTEQKTMVQVIQPRLRDDYMLEGKGIASSIPPQTASPAMKVDENGGIDLNRINVNRIGKTIKVQFDPAQLSGLLQGDFQGFAPVITDFQYIKSPFPLLGVNPAKVPQVLAKA